MAFETRQPGRVIQSWVSPELAKQIRAAAQDERRSVSSMIRIAVEDSLQRRKGASA